MAPNTLYQSEVTMMPQPRARLSEGGLWCKMRWSELTQLTATFGVR